jgi:hypothetical protein
MTAAKFQWSHGALTCPKCTKTIGEVGNNFEAGLRVNPNGKNQPPTDAGQVSQSCKRCGTQLEMVVRERGQHAE